MVQQDSGVVTCDRSPVNRDWDPEHPLGADYNVLNKRISALQKEIAEKQIEAAWKLQELKRALRQEQANLIRISEQMNLERRHNLALQLAMDNPCPCND